MQSRNTKRVAHIDVPGGGQVWVDGNTLYVGHMRNPNGTSILDVTDPHAPKLLFHIPGEKGREVPGRETGGAQMTRVCSGSELPKGKAGETPGYFFQRPKQ